MKRKPSTGRRRSAPTLIILFLLGLVAGVAVDRQYLAGIFPAAVVPTSAVPNFLLMARAWNLIDAHYVDRISIKPTRMTYAAISGMVHSLGDTGHSTFLTPAMMKMTDDAVSGHLVGIGAEVRLKGPHVVIVTPLDGTPAQRARLRPGDVILKVDGKNVTGKPLGIVVEHIRGPIGTKVTLDIRNPKTGKLRSVTLVRAKIPIRNVTWRMLPGTPVADVRIASFRNGTAKTLAQALSAAQSAGARGVILDLRNDPGGLLTEAIEVASQFLTHGNVLLEKSANGKIEPVKVDPAAPKCRLPVAVLINGGTASAAEIVAGALRDGDRAPLIGGKTFGTGTVLQQFALPNGSALLLAVKEWLTPDGHSFWHKGIKPTVNVALLQNAVMLQPDALGKLTPAELRQSTDAQLLSALHLLEKQIGQTTPRAADAISAHYNP